MFLKYFHHLKVKNHSIYFSNKSHFNDFLNLCILICEINLIEFIEKEDNIYIFFSLLKFILLFIFFSKIIFIKLFLELEFIINNLLVQLTI
jgi:hypothetical protein